MPKTKWTTAQVDNFEKISHAKRLAKLKGKKVDAVPTPAADARSRFLAKRLQHSKKK